MLTRNDHGWILSVGGRQWSRAELLQLIGIDDHSRSERLRTTIDTLMGFGPANILVPIAMCTVYALRFNEPWMIVAAIPCLLSVAMLRPLFGGDRAKRLTMTEARLNRGVYIYALVNALGWFVLIAALDMAPLIEDLATNVSVAAQ